MGAKTSPGMVDGSVYAPPFLVYTQKKVEARAGFTKVYTLFGVFTGYMRQIPLVKNDLSHSSLRLREIVLTTD